MNRRKFIRVAGGGIVISATATDLSGCMSSDFPAAALEAWAGPGAEPDLRRWALGYAILAPNSHNRQPWLVDLSTPNAITLYVDRERILPITAPVTKDPLFAQLLKRHTANVDYDTTRALPKQRRKKRCRCFAASATVRSSSTRHGGQ